MSKVSISKLDSYDIEKLYQAIESSLNLLGGISAFISPGEKVLLKPNLLDGLPPERAANTHPEFVRAVIRLVKKTGAKIFVGDSPGFGPAQRAAKGAGILKVCEEENIGFLNFHAQTELSLGQNFSMKKLLIASDVLKMDKIINLPKLKSHQLTYFTGAVKNLFGLVPGMRKAEYHLKRPAREDFINLLLDIALRFKPTLNIMDAILVQEGPHGPMNGDPRQLGLVLASSDALAIDSIAAQIIGIDFKEHQLLSLGEKRGLGNIRGIEVLGEDLSAVKVTDFKLVEKGYDAMLPRALPLWLAKYLQALLLDKVRVEKSKCSHCQRCAEICQAQAISMENTYPTFDYAKCIRCFCCQEMCPAGAIELKKSFLGKIILRIFS